MKNINFEPGSSAESTKTFIIGREKNYYTCDASDTLV